MNLVILSGRLVKDPESRQASTSVTKFTLAVDKDYKKPGEPTCDFINCTCFGKTADVVSKYVTKGTKIIVHGRWQTSNFTNKDGQKIYTNDCIVDKIEFCEKKGSNTAENAEPAPSVNIGGGFMNEAIDDSELPFS